MNLKQQKLSAKLLELASEQFSNHGCNDIDESFWEGWTLDDRKQFVKEYHNWNGDYESYNEANLNIPDYAIMRFLAHKLNNEKLDLKQTILDIEKQLEEENGLITTAVKDVVHICELHKYEIKNKQIKNRFVVINRNDLS